MKQKEIRTALRSRAHLKVANRELRNENNELKRKLDSRYWDSSHEVLDLLFHAGDPALYCAGHRALRERAPHSEQVPASHVVVEGLIQRARQPLLDRISELEHQLKEPT